jgi:hypothetical protein
LHRQHVAQNLPLRVSKGVKGVNHNADRSLRIPVAAYWLFCLYTNSPARSKIAIMGVSSFNKIGFIIGNEYVISKVFIINYCYIRHVTTSDKKHNRYHY